MEKKCGTGNSDLFSQKSKAIPVFEKMAFGRPFVMVSCMVLICHDGFTVPVSKRHPKLSEGGMVGSIQSQNSEFRLISATELVIQ